MSFHSRSFMRRAISKGWIEVASRLQALVGITHRTMVLSQQTANGAADSAHASLRVPLRNRLEYIQRWSPLYDFWLPQLIAQAAKRFPGEICIDVGANVGDTVLAARLAGCDARIIAIEASPTFAAELRHNLAANAAVAGDTQVIEAIVVGRSRSVRFAVHRTATGLTQLDETSPTQGAGAESDSSLPTVKLDELDVTRCSVLKTDTDGFDAFILDGAIEWLGRTRPIIFAETEVTTQAAVDLWRSVLVSLSEQGYGRFMLFDNEGGLCSSGKLDETSVRLIGDMISYSLFERDRFTRGARLKMPVHYFDLALFPSNREAFYDEYRAFVEQQSAGLVARHVAQ